MVVSFQLRHGRALRVAPLERCLPAPQSLGDLNKTSSCYNNSDAARSNVTFLSRLDCLCLLDVKLTVVCARPTVKAIAPTMHDTNPRVIVTSATFESDKSLRSISTFTDGKHNLHNEILDRSRPVSRIWSESTREHVSWIQHVIPWATELVWCLLGIILLMALVMVLSTFNDKPLPDLPLGLTLNTIVAILATAIRAVTVFLIGQGISQAKWNQFVGVHKPLLNLHVFDEASRGPWGSLIMVVRTKGRYEDERPLHMKRLTNPNQCFGDTGCFPDHHQPRIIDINAERHCV